MKKILIVIVAALSVYSVQAQKRVSILGDSYSTFGGEVTPAWNLTWYEGTDGSPVKDNDVKKVEQTWWRIYLESSGNVLEKNNSFSGATICCTGYSQADFSDRAFITRMYNLGNPDIILVFGGTNDSWAKAPIGEYKYYGWTKDDLMTFRPAFAYMLSGMQRMYPEAAIYNITNSELSPEVTESMAQICAVYGVPNIQLHDIDKQLGHPSQVGMKSIAEQLMQVVK